VPPIAKVTVCAPAFASGEADVSPGEAGLPPGEAGVVGGEADGSPGVGVTLCPAAWSAGEHAASTSAVATKDKMRMVVSKPQAMLLDTLRSVTGCRRSAGPGWRTSP
jgi:hypothetical protein